MHRRLGAVSLSDSRILFHDLATNCSTLRDLGVLLSPLTLRPKQRPHSPQASPGDVWPSSPESQLPLGQSRGISPSDNNIRTAAEWGNRGVDHHAFLPLHLKQITAAAVEECRVVIFSEDAEEYLSGFSCGGSVSLDNVESNAGQQHWIRDYGANTVYTEFHDGRVLVDWLYNRPRPDDDAIPDALAAHMGILHSTIEAPNDLMSTEHWMSDGFGTAFSSELIFEENSEPPPTGDNNGARIPTRVRLASTVWSKPFTGLTPTSK